MAFASDSAATLDTSTLLQDDGGMKLTRVQEYLASVVQQVFIAGGPGPVEIPSMKPSLLEVTQDVVVGKFLQDDNASSHVITATAFIEYHATVQHDPACAAALPNLHQQLHSTITNPESPIPLARLVDAVVRLAAHPAPSLRRKQHPTTSPTSAPFPTPLQLAQFLLILLPRILNAPFPPPKDVTSAQATLEIDSTIICLYAGILAGLVPPPSAPSIFQHALRRLFHLARRAQVSPATLPAFRRHHPCNLTTLLQGWGSFHPGVLLLTCAAEEASLIPAATIETMCDGLPAVGRRGLHPDLRVNTASMNNIAAMVTTLQQAWEYFRMIDSWMPLTAMPGLDPKQLADMSFSGGGPIATRTAVLACMEGASVMELHRYLSERAIPRNSRPLQLLAIFAIDTVCTTHPEWAPRFPFVLLITQTLRRLATIWGTGDDGWLGTQRFAQFCHLSLGLAVQHLPTVETKKELLLHALMQATEHATATAASTAPRQPGVMDMALMTTRVCAVAATACAALEAGENGAMAVKLVLDETQAAMTTAMKEAMPHDTAHAILTATAEMQAAIVASLVPGPDPPTAVVALQQVEAGARSDMSTTGACLATGESAVLCIHRGAEFMTRFAIFATLHAVLRICRAFRAARDRIQAIAAWVDRITGGNNALVSHVGLVPLTVCTTAIRVMAALLPAGSTLSETSRLPFVRMFQSRHQLRSLPNAAPESPLIETGPAAQFFLALQAAMPEVLVHPALDWLSVAAASTAGASAVVPGNAAAQARPAAAAVAAAAGMEGSDMAARHQAVVDAASRVLQQGFTANLSEVRTAQARLETMLRELHVMQKQTRRQLAVLRGTVQSEEERLQLVQEQAAGLVAQVARLEQTIAGRSD